MYIAGVYGLGNQREYFRLVSFRGSATYVIPIRILPEVVEVDVHVVNAVAHSSMLARI
jgi:hypothetical protein